MFWICRPTSYCFISGVSAHGHLSSHALTYRSLCIDPWNTTARTTITHQSTGLYLAIITSISHIFTLFWDIKHVLRRAWTHRSLFYPWWCLYNVEDVISAIEVKIRIKIVFARMLKVFCVFCFLVCGGAMAMAVFCFLVWTFLNIFLLIPNRLLLYIHSFRLR